MNPRFTTVKVSIALLLSVAIVASIATILNIKFYQVHGPFYDSMAYMNHLAWVMSQAKEQGILSAISNSVTQSTVFLPWVLGAFLALFTEPSRILGVVIQLPLVLLQLVTGYRYFRIVAGMTENRSILYALPLIAYPAVFFFNGGLSDFRMDLSQAMGYGAFLASLMVARKTGAIKEWLWVGLVISIVCLFRATTPVYIAIILALSFLLDVWKKGGLAIVPGYLALSFVVLCLAGWFFVVNFDYLYYYYFTWNPDANARLSLTLSIRHIYFLVAQHIGWILLSAFFIVMSTALFSAIQSGQRWRLNWLMLVGGLVPISYLVASGAGLNPFVSIVAVPGVMMFMLHPAEHKREQHSKIGLLLAPVALTAGLLLSVATSLYSFNKTVGDWIPQRAGIDQLVNLIREDTGATGIGQARVAFLYLGSVDGSVITNHLVYEKGYRYRRNPGHVELEGFHLSVRHYRSYYSKVEWAKIPGMTDAAKMNYIVNDAMKHTDYLIMADENSSLSMHYPINSLANEMRKQLETSRLKSLQTGLVLSTTESVTVYRTISAPQ